MDSSVVGERAGGAGGGASRPTPVNETSVIRCGETRDASEPFHKFSKTTTDLHLWAQLAAAGWARCRGTRAAASAELAAPGPLWVAAGAAWTG